MSTKHTPEPWAIERARSGSIKAIGPCVAEEYAGSAWLEVPEEDARRIVACVNACRGIDDELLTDDCIRKTREDRDELLKQRDELLKSLRWAVREIERNTCSHEDTEQLGFIWTRCRMCGKQWADDEGGFVPHKDCEELEAARSAIAKATGAPK